jgi:mono/diheme cytochrome c family protein
MLRETTLALAALVLAASIGAGAMAQEQNGSAPHGPPAGPALTLINERCSACHTADQVLSARKTPEDWASTVQSMVDRGADLNADEQTALVAYLRTNFSAAPSPSGGATQPTGPAAASQRKSSSH